MIKLNQIGELGVENIDVFCEKGVYNVEQTKSILKAGKDQGNFRINFHGEELNYLGSVEVSLKHSVKTREWKLFSKYVVLFYW